MLRSSRPRRRSPLFLTCGIAVMLVPLGTVPAAAQVADELPLVRVLTDTGETRDDLPVFALHADPAATVAAVSKGMAGELLGVYRMTQEYLRRADRATAQPAYLLLSEHQGGFARYGFWLGDERLDDVAYVDVYKGWPLVGRFGAIDQIFPHELWHAIRKQVVGVLDEGFANQVHALGVRTDRGVAFNEGFAESFQALAIDHPGADPATRALAADAEARARVLADLGAYARELEARLTLATRWRTGFVLWFANGEDVLRYHGIRDNLYAGQPTIATHLLDRDDPYGAYLYDSIVPAAAGAPLRSPTRMLAIEGVVAALACAWANDPDLQSSYRDADFYARFGTTAALVTPLQNVYLKMIHASHERRPWDVAQLVDAYIEAFADEVPFVERVVASVYGQPRLQPPAELWLANVDFQTGTTLFDQFRGLPRTHTFDLNAPSLIDLRSVAGVSLELARRIQAGGPYATVADLRRLDGMTPAVLERFEAMQSAMQELLQRAADEEETLSIQAILLPSVWRLVGALLATAFAGALLYRQVRRRGPAAATPSWLRAALVGITAAAAGLTSGWAAGTAAGLGSLAGVTLVLGLPAAVVCWWRGRSVREASIVIVAWLAAATPAAVAVTPLF